MLGSGWATVAVNFMLETLFPEGWPWWAWAILSIPGWALMWWAVWKQRKLDRSDLPVPPVEVLEASNVYEYRLARRKQTMDFVSKNAI